MADQVVGHEAVTCASESLTTDLEETSDAWIAEEGQSMTIGDGTQEEVEQHLRVGEPVGKAQAYETAIDPAEAFSRQGPQARGVQDGFLHGGHE